MIFKNRKNIFYVEIGIILLSGIGGLLALISVCFRGSWISQEYFDKIHMHRSRDHLSKLTLKFNRFEFISLICI